MQKFKIFKKKKNKILEIKLIIMMIICRIKEKKKLRSREIKKKKIYIMK